MTEPIHSPRVFSGVQPTGVLTLGNYLGALRQFVDLQTFGEERYFCIVDMHALTVAREPHELREANRRTAAIFLACGIDPQQATIFIQSDVPEHAELAWIFQCVARLGWLNRMTQFKDKAGKHKEKASVGLYAYPTLMAADILAYKATHVPVGEDQKQHLELSRNIAQKFNEDFQAPDFFPLPEPLIGGTGARVMSLRDGTQKMSKSDPSAFSRIELFDEPDIILQKIRKARTDAEPLPEAAEDLEPRAEARNLVGIYAAIRRITNQDVLAKWAGKGFAEFKPALAEVIIDEIGPLKAKAEGYLADRASLDAALTSGADKARARAADIVAEAKRLVGFGIRA